MSYSNSDISHAFAHQTENKKNGSNLFYETYENGSSTIYSYGYHFGIAHILEPSKYGLNICLFTEASYSNSTAKHINHVSRACSHFDKIYVPCEVTSYIDSQGNLSAGYYQVQKDIDHFNSELNSYIGKHLRARKYSYLDDILSLINNVKKYVDLFNCKHRLSGKIRKAIYEDISNESDILNTFFTELEVQKIKDKKEAERKRKAQALKTEIDMFRKGKKAFVSGSNYTYLRLNNDIVQTSKGINLPLKDAKLIWAALQIAKRDNKEIEKPCTVSTINGSAWKVDTIKPDYIKAGCHTVTYSEAKRIAKQIGWIK